MNCWKYMFFSLAFFSNCDVMILSSICQPWNTDNNIASHDHITSVSNLILRNYNQNSIPVAVGCCSINGVGSKWMIQSYLNSMLVAILTDDKKNKDNDNGDDLCWNLNSILPGPRIALHDMRNFIVFFICIVALGIGNS